MNVNAIIARLRETGTPFRQVGGAVDFALAAESLKTFPAAFVIPGDETGGKNDRQGPGSVFQIVQAPLAVVVVVRDLKDAQKLGARDATEEARAFVRSKLLGWTPPGAADADFDCFTFTKGGIVGTNLGALWYQDDYLTTYTIANPAA